MNPSNQLTAKQTAERMGLTTRQLQALRLRGIGPAIVQNGLNIFYPLNEVALIEEHEAQAILKQVLRLPSPLGALKHLCDQYQLKPSPILKEVTSPSNTEFIATPTDSVPIELSSALIKPSPERPVTQHVARPALDQTAAQPLTTRTKTWYLVHTKARQESTALTNLERQGYTCYLPKINKHAKNSTKRHTTEPMFPRYLFVQLDDGDNGHNWMPIRSTRGVDKLVQFGDTYPKIDSDLIHSLKARVQDTPIQPHFKKGDAVQILDGPFKDLDAIFYTSDSEHRVIILMDFLTRQLPVKIASERLRKHA